MPAPSISLKRFIKEEIGNSERILDIGCGDGVLAFFLISSLNCRIDGIDLDKGGVHRANKKFIKRQTKGKAICHIWGSKYIRKKFQRGTFDAVLIIHTFHHLEDLADVLKKTRYVMKNKGKIFVGEYERNYGEKLDNCPRFSNKKIISMLRTAGFRNIRNNDIHKNFVMITGVK